MALFGTMGKVFTSPRLKKRKFDPEKMSAEDIELPRVFRTIEKDELRLLVKEEIDKVDCVVLPSYREGLSRVLLEAASMAKPIITTDVPGCRDIVEDGINGYLVKAKDSAELSDAIKRILLLSQEERESMGELGRKRVVNNFSEESVIKLYLSAVQSQLNPILFEV